jgi:predicted DNA-binding protein (UPF0251 family)
MFKPAGIPARALDEVLLTLDELEALRLADLEGLYQDEAAVRMSVSRPTFGRIVEAARRKVARALLQGLVLRIDGGTIYTDHPDPCRCRNCATSRAGTPEAARPRSTQEKSE